jgi:ABC-type Zn uptake system ZnuABC Zn-binding protein ZnuA
MPVFNGIAFSDLFSQNLDVLGGINADLTAVCAITFQYSDNDIIANHDGFAYFAGENEHDEVLIKSLMVPAVEGPFR